MTQHDSEHIPSRSGFTLIELLVTIAIVALLAGFLLVALRGARRGADRAETLNAMRGMMTAYTAYSTEHEGRLLPGYILDSDLQIGGGSLDITARFQSNLLDQLPNRPVPPDTGKNDPTATDRFVALDTAPYLWRLAPYFDHQWQATMTDYRESHLITYLDREFWTGRYGEGTTAGPFLGLARVTSFGLNSIHLGGDSRHGPRPDNAPWRLANNKKPFVAQRASDVLNPTKMIVFGTCSANPAVGLPNPSGTAESLGYCELRAPFADDDGDDATPPVAQWTVDSVSGSPTEGQAIWSAAGPGGAPIARLGDDKVPISHLDGHVTSESLSRLSVDLSRWIPNKFSQQ